MSSEQHWPCEPPTYDEPVGTEWTCPDCDVVYESRPVEELPDWLRRMPGIGVATTAWIERRHTA